MEPLDVFTVRDLRQRSGDLLRDAEQGRLAGLLRQLYSKVLIPVQVFEELPGPGTPASRSGTTRSRRVALRQVPML